MTTVKLTLPDQLALEAQRAGLLTPQFLEKWLREELRTLRSDQLFAAAGRMSATDDPGIMTPEEVAQEIDALRAKKRKQRPL